jgi:hypothetical protein
LIVESARAVSVQASSLRVAIAETCSRDGRTTITSL